MKQLDAVIDKCKTAIHAGIPILYIESDDIAIIDDLLHSEEMVRFWTMDADLGWMPSNGRKPDNIYVTNRNLDMSFCWTGGPDVQKKAESSLITEGTKPWLKNKKHIPFVIGVRNFLPTRQNEYKEPAEDTLINHVSRIVTSSPDDDIRRCTIILQSPVVSIPKGIESYVEVIDVPKLEDDEIKEIIIAFAKENGEKTYTDLLEQLVVNLRGFTPRKIKEILQRIELECNGIFNIEGEETGINLIRSVKEQMLKKEGLLTLVKTNPDMNVSGLDNITNWIKQRAELFNDPIKTEKLWNLSTPKGILVSGIPGTGKSALANEIAKIFAPLPLLQFDMGSVLGKYSGESEANMRRVLKLAESISPCILWIDEIEKAFSSASSSGDADGGQGKRLFGQFLTWMQEKKAPCFIYATANEINKLPPEFLRRGRFDQKFFTFMPTKEDCIAIVKGNFIRYNRGGKPFSKILSNPHLDNKLCQFIEFCGQRGKFMIGADIEGIIKDAMFAYYSKYWHGKLNQPESYDFEKFFIEMEEVVIKVQTYGETDMDKIADRLMLLAMSKFSPASTSNNLISLEDVDVRNISIPEYKGTHDDNNTYDKLLYDKIKAEVEFIHNKKNPKR